MSLEGGRQKQLLTAAQNTARNAFENVFGASQEPGMPHFTLDIGIHAYSMLPDELKGSFLTVEMMEISDAALMHMYGGSLEQQKALSWIFEVGEQTSQETVHKLLRTLHEKALGNETYFIPQVATWLWPEECKNIEIERPWSAKRFFAWNPVYVSRMGVR